MHICITRPIQGKLSKILGLPSLGRNFDEYYFKADNPLKKFKDSLGAFSGV